MMPWDGWLPNRNEVVELLSDLVRTPSMNPYLDEATDVVGYGEAAMAAKVRRWFDESGIPVEQDEVLPGRPNVIARVPGADHSRSVLLQTHMDTVPAPWLEGGPEATVKNGKVWGLGSCDAKGCLTAMMLALRHAAAVGPPVNAILSAAVDEEHAFRGVLHFVRSGIEAEAAVVGEPTEMRVIVAHKGVMRWQIETRGKAGHAAHPEAGVNAISAMAKVVAYLDEVYAPRLAQRRHALLGSPTVNVGLIRGGAQVNVVPDSCMIDVDRRYIPEESSTGVLKEIDEILEELRGRHPTLDVVRHAPYIDSVPLGDTINGAAATALERAHRDVTHRATYRIGVPFGTDASKLEAAGIPAVVYGPGSISQAHQPGEFVEIDEVRKAAAVYARWLLSVPDPNGI